MHNLTSPARDFPDRWVGRLGPIPWSL
jgi:hypothetical protein